MTKEILDLSRRLRRLEDRQELADLIARYGIAVDDRDMNTLGDLFSRSATVQHSQGRSTGRDAVIAFYRGRLSQFGPTYHYPHTQTIDFLSDEEATGVVAAHAEMAIGKEAVMAAIRYMDRYVREDGRWKFLERGLRFLYVLPLQELPRFLSERLRKRWPGTTPAEADLPETLDTWKAFQK